MMVIGGLTNLEVKARRSPGDLIHRSRRRTISFCIQFHPAYKVLKFEESRALFNPEEKTSRVKFRLCCCGFFSEPTGKHRGWLHT